MNAYELLELFNSNAVGLEVGRPVLPMLAQTADDAADALTTFGGPASMRLVRAAIAPAWRIRRAARSAREARSLTMGRWWDAPAQCRACAAVPGSMWPGARV